VKTAKSRLSGDPTDRDLATGSENDLSPGINFRYRRENPQAKESFRCISLTQQRNRLGFGAREPKRVSQRGAFHHFVKPFVMTWEFRPNRKICPAFEQQLCYRETPIPILRGGVENWRLPTDTSPIHSSTHIYVGSTIKKKLGCFRISELGSNMQQRRSLQEQATSGCTAAVKFLKSPMHEIRRLVQLLGYSDKSAAQQIQKARHVVLRGTPSSD
jgi:hypothetical protein